METNNTVGQPNTGEKKTQAPRRFEKNYSRRDRGPRENEPFEVMLRRFFRDVQQSGVLTEIKKRRSRDKTLSREILRASARRKAARRKIKRGY